MAKKKVNVRKDYSYAAKKSLPKYKPAKIARKLQFLILRGPGLDANQVIQENIQIKKFADQQLIKLKFLTATTEDSILKALKEGNTWAAGIALHLGSLTDESGKIKKVISQILCPTLIVNDDEYEIALQKLIQENRA